MNFSYFQFWQYKSANNTRLYLLTFWGMLVSAALVVKNFHEWKEVNFFYDVNNFIFLMSTIEKIIMRRQTKTFAATRESPKHWRVPGHLTKHLRVPAFIQKHLRVPGHTCAPPKTLVRAYPHAPSKTLALRVPPKTFVRSNVPPQTLLRARLSPQILSRTRIPWKTLCLPACLLKHLCVPAYH